MPTHGPIRSTSITDNGTTVSTPENLQLGGGAGAVGANETILAGASQTAAPGFVPYALQVVNDTANSLGIQIIRTSNDTGGANLMLGKSRSPTGAGVAAVVSGDSLTRIRIHGADGTTFSTSTQSAEILATVNGAVSTGVIPTDLVFKTSATNSTGLAEAFRIGSTQVCTFANGFVTTAGVVNLGGFSRVTGSNFTTTGQALTNVTGLTFATVANATYHFRAIMSVSSSSVAGNQYGIQHSGAGASVEAQAYGTLAAGGAQSVRLNALNTATAAFNTNGGDGAMEIEGILVVGANAGNLTVQVLKTTSGTATIYINSFMDVKRIA